MIDRKACALFAMSICGLAACRDVSRIEGPVDLFDVDPQIVTSIEYRAAEGTIVARRAKDGTFTITERRVAMDHDVTCRPGHRFDEGMRPLFRIRGLRQLKPSEVDRLPPATADGLLRIQDDIAHEGGDLEPAQWKMFPHFGEAAPVVAMPRGAEWGGDSGEAWEVDIPKNTLQRLRAGCGHDARAGAADDVRARLASAASTSVTNERP